MKYEYWHRWPAPTSLDTSMPSSRPIHYGKPIVIMQHRDGVFGRRRPLPEDSASSEIVHIVRGGLHLEGADPSHHGAQESPLAQHFPP